MSNRKIINAAATGGIGYYPVGNPTDAYYDNVSLLLNGDVEVDSNFANVSLLLDGNTLTDKSNNKAAVTAYGNAAVTSVNKKFGTGSYYFDGNGDYLSIPASANFSFGTGDVTIEAWIWWESATYIATGRLICGNNGPGTTDQFGIFEGVGMSCFGISNNVAANYPPVQQWVHVACSKQGSTVRLFINGVMTASGTQTAAVGNSTYPMLIGTRANDTQWYHWWNGYIDDFRITKGVARYTANFTPPVKALPTHEILDSSVYRLPVTTYGNARIDTTTKKFGTSAMFFDGTGDYLTLLPNINLAFPADFTIELWFNSSSFAAQRTLMSTAGYYVAGNNGNWTFRVTSASSIAFAQYNSQSPGGGGWEFTVPVMSTGTWYHVAVARSNGTISLYLNGTASSTTYSNLSNISDGSVSNVYVGRNVSYDNDWIGYIDDLRITKGYARYTANFTPPSASLPTIPPTIPADPWWGNVSLLLDGNTTDAYDPYWQNVSLMLTGDDFIDWSNQHNSITNTGTVTLDTTNKKFNASSLAFSGSKYLTVPSNSAFEFGTGDFTVDCWIRFTTVQDCAFFQTSNDISAANGPFWFGYSGGKLTASRHGSASYALGYTWTPTTGVWYYVAVTRQSGTTNVYLNGSVVATSSTIHNGVSFTQAGAAVGVLTTPAYFQGQIADLRITKGVARTITVPTAALPSYKIQDRTQNNLTLTPYGNVQLSTDVMKNGTGSMFFDGTGDYLSITPVTNMIFGSGDFTVEFWAYFPTYPTGLAGDAQGYVAFRDQAGGNYGVFIGVLSANTNKIFATSAGIDITSNATYALNSWNHIAYVKSGSTVTLYQNGVSVGSATHTANMTSTNATINIGRGEWSGSPTLLNGYIDDLRITKGYARYTQNFTPPSQSFATQYISTGYDANYADVSLLLNGNGTNGSQVFTDLSSSPKTITAYGNAQISTAVKKYGTGAMYFDGTGDVLKTPPVSAFTFGTGDFTVEGWFYQTADRIYPSALEINNHLGVGGILFITKSSGVACIYAADTGGGSFIAPQATTLNTWNHIAWVRNNGVLRTYVNGVSSSSAALTLNITATTSVTIGGEQSVTEGYCFPGYIDDLRITKGIARYTTNFTPPTYQLPTDTTGTVIDPLRSSTSLLLRGNGTNGSTSFTDESPNGLTVTNNGSVTVNTTTKKYGTGSMAFSGSNYLSIAHSTGQEFNSGDFTIEFWCYQSAFSVTSHWVSQWNSTTGYNFAVYSVNGLLRFAYTTNGSTVTTLSSTYTLTTNTWIHVAVVRNNASLLFFVDGNLKATTSISGTLYSGTGALEVGRNGDNTQYYTGYIDDLRITKGYARYTSNFTPPTYEDPIVTGTVYDYNYPQVSLLLNGDGTNGSTVFKDLSSSPKTITNNGSVTVNTTTKKFSTGSMAFSGTNYLSLSTPAENIINWYSSDYTLEYWVNPTSFGSSSNSGSNVVGHAATADSGEYWSFGPLAGGTVKFYYYNGSPVGFASTTTIATGVWTHLAFVKYGTALTIYINGVSSATATMSGTPQSGNTLFFLVGKVTSATAFTGYIDDLRITKGLARYTQNFTPPTAPLPTSYS